MTRSDLGISCTIQNKLELYIEWNTRGVLVQLSSVSPFNISLRSLTSLLYELQRHPDNFHLVVLITFSTSILPLLEVIVSVNASRVIMIRWW